MWGWEGLYGRPRPVPLTSMLGGTRSPHPAGDPKDPPIHITRRPGPSTPVGAGVDEDVGLGRLRRPRPCSSCSNLAATRPHPTPRATIKALPTPRRPPSPL